MVPDVGSITARMEEAMDDDAESIITNERYTYITSIIGRCYTKKSREKMSVSDKIDHIVTNRFLALPILRRSCGLSTMFQLPQWDLGH